VAAKTFRCTIVTPSRPVFDDEVQYVSFPAWDGQQGVMVGQSPLLTRLGIGSLRLEHPDGREQRYAVDGGFAEVREGVFTVLTRHAIAREDLSAEEAEAELRQANARAVASGVDRAEVEAQQLLARTKRRLALASAGRSGVSDVAS
jgi:F-type H+-transporting ATPase subunit epsilon